MADSGAKDGNVGRALLAILGGCAAIAALCWFGLPLLPSAPLAVVLAGAFLLATALWGLAYAWALRDSGPYARLIALLLIAAVGIGVSYDRATKLAVERREADLRTLIEMELDDNGLPLLPAGAEDRGPITTLYAAYVRELIHGQQALNAQAEKAGVLLLADATALHADPKLLSDCSRVTGVKRAMEAMIERRRSRFKALVVGLAETPYPPAYKRALVAGMDAEASDSELAQMAALHGRILDAAQGACGVLARRRWTAEGPLFVFGDAGDVEAFSAFGQQQNQANAELQRLQAAARKRMHEGQARMRKALDGALS